MKKSSTKNHAFYKEKKAKTVSRLYSVQALFQMEAGNIALDQVQLEFENYHDKENNKLNNFVKADMLLFRKIIEKTIKDQNLIDQSIKLSLKKEWSIERIDPTLRAIFRAASAELILKTPPKVVINEFLEVTKAFFPNGKECQLANGILDNLAKTIVKENVFNEHSL